MGAWLSGPRDAVAVPQPEQAIPSHEEVTHTPTQGTSETPFHQECKEPGTCSEVGTLSPQQDGESQCDNVLSTTPTLASSLDEKESKKMEALLQMRSRSTSFHTHGHMELLDIPGLGPNFGVDDCRTPPPPYSAKSEPVQLISPSCLLQDVELSDKVLGTGSYGSVRLGTYNNLPVAAKCMHSVLQESSRCIQQFENEIELLKNVRHPNIVTFMGIFYSDSGYLIMEYLEGGSMYQLVDSLQAGTRMVTQHQKMHILRDICLALEHLHSRDIIHRDLSSSNVLLNTDLRAKVSDFGMSRLSTVSRNQPSTLAPGCYLYMPPEWLNHSVNGFSHKGDMFSFFVLVMELMIEEHPRRLGIGKREVDRRKRDLNEFCQKAPKPLHELVMQGLEDNPDVRPSAKSVNPQLKQFLDSLEDDPCQPSVEIPLPHQASDGQCQVASPLILRNEQGTQGSVLCQKTPVASESHLENVETHLVAEETLEESESAYPESFPCASCSTDNSRSVLVVGPATFVFRSYMPISCVLSEEDFLTISDMPLPCSIISEEDFLTMHAPPTIMDELAHGPLTSSRRTCNKVVRCVECCSDFVSRLLTCGKFGAIPAECSATQLPWNFMDFVHDKHILTVGLKPFSVVMPFFPNPRMSLSCVLGSCGKSYQYSIRHKLLSGHNSKQHTCLPVVPANKSIRPSISTHQHNTLTGMNPLANNFGRKLFYMLSTRLECIQYVTLQEPVLCKNMASPISLSLESPGKIPSILSSACKDRFSSDRIICTFLYSCLDRQISSTMTIRSLCLAHALKHAMCSSVVVPKFILCEKGSGQQKNPSSVIKRMTMIQSNDNEVARQHLNSVYKNTDVCRHIFCKPLRSLSDTQVPAIPDLALSLFSSNGNACSYISCVPLQSLPDVHFSVHGRVPPIQAVTSLFVSKRVSRHSNIHACRSMLLPPAQLSSAIVPANTQLKDKLFVAHTLPCNFTCLSATCFVQVHVMPGISISARMDFTYKCHFAEKYSFVLENTPFSVLLLWRNLAAVSSSKTMDTCKPAAASLFQPVIVRLSGRVYVISKQAVMDFVHDKYILTVDLKPFSVVMPFFPNPRMSLSCVLVSCGKSYQYSIHHKLLSGHNSKQHTCLPVVPANKSIRPSVSTHQHNTLTGMNPLANNFGRKLFYMLSTRLECIQYVTLQEPVLCKNMASPISLSLESPGKIPSVLSSACKDRFSSDRIICTFLYSCLDRQISSTMTIRSLCLAHALKHAMCLSIVAPKFLLCEKGSGQQKNPSSVIKRMTMIQSNDNEVARQRLNSVCMNTDVCRHIFYKSLSGTQVPAIPDLALSLFSSNGNACSYISCVPLQSLPDVHFSAHGHMPAIQAVTSLFVSKRLSRDSNIHACRSMLFPPAQLSSTIVPANIQLKDKVSVAYTLPYNFTCLSVTCFVQVHVMPGIGISARMDFTYKCHFAEKYPYVLESIPFSVLLLWRNSAIISTVPSSKSMNAFKAAAVSLVQSIIPTKPRLGLIPKQGFHHLIISESHNTSQNIIVGRSKSVISPSDIIKHDTLTWLCLLVYYPSLLKNVICTDHIPAVMMECVIESIHDISKYTKSFHVVLEVPGHMTYTLSSEEIYTCTSRYHQCVIIPLCGVDHANLRAAGAQHYKLSFFLPTLYKRRKSQSRVRVNPREETSDWSKCAKMALQDQPSHTKPVNYNNVLLPVLFLRQQQTSTLVENSAVTSSSAWVNQHSPYTACTKTFDELSNHLRASNREAAPSTSILGLYQIMQCHISVKARMLSHIQRIDTKPPLTQIPKKYTVSPRADRSSSQLVPRWQCTDSRPAPVNHWSGGDNRRGVNGDAYDREDGDGNNQQVSREADDTDEEHSEENRQSPLVHSDIMAKLSKTRAWGGGGISSDFQEWTTCSSPLPMKLSQGEYQLLMGWMMVAILLLHSPPDHGFTRLIHFLLTFTATWCYRQCDKKGKHEYITGRGIKVLSLDDRHPHLLQCVMEMSSSEFSKAFSNSLRSLFSGSRRQSHCIRPALDPSTHREPIHALLQHTKAPNLSPFYDLQTTADWRPDLLPLDLTQPVTVRTSPQSEGTSTSGGSSATKAGKDSGSGGTGGTGEGNDCVSPGNAGGGRRGRDDDDDDNRLTQSNPVTDIDGEISEDEEEKEEESSGWQTTRKTGPQPEPIDPDCIPVEKKLPLFGSVVKENVDRTKDSGGIGLSPQPPGSEIFREDLHITPHQTTCSGGATPDTLPETSNQLPIPHHEGTSCKKREQQRIRHDNSQSAFHELTAVPPNPSSHTSTPILLPTSLTTSGNSAATETCVDEVKCFQKNESGDEAALKFQANLSTTPQEEAASENLASSGLVIGTNIPSYSQDSFSNSGSQYSDAPNQFGTVSLEGVHGVNHTASEPDSENSGFGVGKQEWEVAEECKDNPYLQYNRPGNKSQKNSHSNSSDLEQPVHEEANPFHQSTSQYFTPPVPCVLPDAVAVAGACDGEWVESYDSEDEDTVPSYMVTGRTSKSVHEPIETEHEPDFDNGRHRVENQEQKESEVSIDNSHLQQGHNNVYANNGEWEEAIQCVDVGEENPTITSHQPALTPTEYRPLPVICILSDADVASICEGERVSLGTPYTVTPMYAGPRLLDIETSDDHNVSPMEENPVMPRLFEELRQSSILPVHSSQDGLSTPATALPIEEYLERAVYNGDSSFIAEVLKHLMHCLQVCLAWRTPFLLDCSEVYVDIDTHELIVNATQCIEVPRHCDVSEVICRNNFFDRLRLMLKRLLTHVNLQSGSSADTVDNSSIKASVNLLWSLLVITNNSVSSDEDRLLVQYL